MVGLPAALGLDQPSGPVPRLLAVAVPATSAIRSPAIERVDAAITNSCPGRLGLLGIATAVSFISAPCWAASWGGRAPALDPQSRLGRGAALLRAVLSHRHDPALRLRHPAALVPAGGGAFRHKYGFNLRPSAASCGIALGTLDHHRRDRRLGHRHARHAHQRSRQDYITLAEAKGCAAHPLRYGMRNALLPQLTSWR